MVYADTSFLIAIYLPEEGSERVIRWMEKAREALPLTPFHRHELRTGVRQRVFRGELTAGKMKEVFREVESDLSAGVLLHVPIPWTDAFREAEQTGAGHGEQISLRSLDLLHIGIARAFGSAQFLTLDTRQAAAASIADLRTRF